MIYKIKRLSDGMITHIQKSDDPNYKPKIPSRWGLENNHEVIVEPDPIPSVQELRKSEYQKHDDLRDEAIVEKLQGRDEKWLEYLAIREAIKLKYPKPLQ